MQNIITEITCGLVAVCLHVRKSVTGCTMVTDRSTFGKDKVDAHLHRARPAVVPAARSPHHLPAKAGSIPHRPETITVLPPPVTFGD
jgi:hypothetical protein